MKLPKKIIIGPHVYKIKCNKESSQVLKGTGNVGECHTKTATIYIAPGLSSSGKKETIIHEILHAIWDLSPLREEIVTEEQAILIITPCLIKILQDKQKLGDILNIP